MKHVLKRYDILQSQWVYYNEYGNLNHSTDPYTAYVFGRSNNDPKVEGQWIIETYEDYLADLKNTRDDLMQQWSMYDGKIKRLEG